MQDDQKLKFFQKCFDCRCGTLWWGAEDFIQERFDNWYPSNSPSHPLLSVRQGPVTALHDSIPMLVGTSVKPNREIHLPITLTKLTDFGTKLLSKNIFAYDFLYNDESTSKRIWANTKKPRITSAENILLQKYISRQENIAKEQKGYVS